MLCKAPLAFSAMHSARRSGKYRFISAGASVPGVNWNSIRTPSMVRISPVAVMLSLGGTSVTVPRARVGPSPDETWPVGDRGNSQPNM